MATWIDWHSHHTPPELAEEFGRFTGKKPPIDSFDSPDFSTRLREMDDVALDLPLVCPGAGAYADQRPADRALAMTLAFLIETLGEERIVFGSDYCGGLGTLKKAFAGIDKQPNPGYIKSFTERNSRRLLHL